MTTPGKRNPAKLPRNYLEHKDLGFQTWHSETFLSFTKICALTFYLRFFQSPLDPIGYRVLFCWVFLYLLQQKYAIFLTSKIFLVFFTGFQFCILSHAKLLQTQNLTSQGSRAPCFNLYSLCLVRDNGAVLCIFPVRALCAHSQSHGSFLQESQFKRSDFVQHFQLPLEYFCSSGELQPCCDPWAALSSLPTGFQPWRVITVGFCGVAYAHIWIVD